MMKNLEPIKVMVAGIGGASLGTEIGKCLLLAENYEIYGCDISATAYGLYESDFKKTYRIDRDDYVAGVLRACQDAKIQFLIPGGEQPMTLLGGASKLFEESEIKLVANTSEIIALYSDKDLTFKKLRECSIDIPKTIAIVNKEDLDYVGLPCIVKPATGSGGSVGVFFVTNADEAMIYADFIRRNGNLPIAQEYVGDDEGEFTIGVLSLPTQEVVGSIALKRSLDAKLSVAYRGRGGVISSGYSQGYIGNYPNLCTQAETIARSIGSCGPINIQGRVRNGKLLPFEINPRFSASTYLRALAGFNEIDLLIKYFITGYVPSQIHIKEGWYLRSLTESFVSAGEIK